MKKTIITLLIFTVTCALTAQTEFDNRVIINQTDYPYPHLSAKAYQGLYLGGHPHLAMTNVGGTFENPLPTPANILLGTIIYSGYDGEKGVQVGRISVSTTDVFSVGNHPAKMNFQLGGTTACCGINRMTIDGLTGNVGIGTTTPDRRIEIGNGGATNLSAYGRFNGTWNTAYEKHARLEFNDKNFGIGAGRLTTNGTDDDLYLWSYGGEGRDISFLSTLNGESDPSTWNHNMIIKGTNGNVGIGTKSPQLKLEVDGSNNAIGVGQSAYGWNDTHLIGAEYAAWGGSRTNAPGTYYYRWTGTGTNYHVGYFGQEQNSGNWGLAFKTDVKDAKTFATTTRMFIDTEGNVGVGTISPETKLQVKDGINMKISLGALNTGANTYASKEPVLLFNRWSGTSNQYITNGIEILKFENTNNYGLAFTRTPLHTENDYSNSAVSMFIENDSGQVGIGTTTPDMELTVKGKIHAEEVKIDLSVPAPDYVFKKDYNLRSLDELEHFITKNSHLPEIPSAKAFEQNGIMQAEMDMSLLKKIEELTLYTIQQQKEIQQQAKDIETLKLLVERLAKVEAPLEGKQ